MRGRATAATPVVSITTFAPAPFVNASTSSPTSEVRALTHCLAPYSSASRRRLLRTSVASIRHPIGRSNWVRAKPMGPWPSTTTQSSDVSPSRLTMLRATVKGSRLAASTSVTSSESRSRLKMGTANTPCIAPSKCKPISFLFGHSSIAPDKHLSHRRHGKVGRMRTRVPCSREPASSINTPAQSWPGTRGRSTGIVPSKMWTSVPQIPAAPMATKAWSGGQEGGSRSSTKTRRVSWMTQASTLDPVRCLRVPVHWLLLQVHPHGLDLGVVLHHVDAVLTAVPRLLVTAEGHQPIPDAVVVYPHRPRTYLRRHAVGSLEVPSPYGAGKSVARVVSLLDRISLVLKSDHPGDRAEDLFARDPHAIVDVVQNRRCKEVTAVGGVSSRRFSSSDDLRSFAGAYADIFPYLLELSVGRLGAHLSRVLKWVADPDRACFFREPLEELVFDRPLDQGTRGRHAGLTRCREDAVSGPVDGLV